MEAYRGVMSTPAEQLADNVLLEIEAGMKPFSCVVSQRDGYVRVWNCYCGAIMGAYNKKLDEVCARLGLQWKRVQTAGPVGGSDWEDQVTAKAA